MSVEVAADRLNGVFRRPMAHEHQRRESQNQRRRREQRDGAPGHLDGLRLAAEKAKKHRRRSADQESERDFLGRVRVSGDAAYADQRDQQRSDAENQDLPPRRPPGGDEHGKAAKDGGAEAFVSARGLDVQGRQASAAGFEEKLGEKRRDEAGEQSGRKGDGVAPRADREEIEDRRQRERAEKGDMAEIAEKMHR